MGQTKEKREITALCLSGGGLRASYFHLGVVWAMRCAGCLDGVKEIYSVSGGSILAAHLVLNWERYSSKDDEVALAVAKEFVEKTGSDIRGRVVRRAILSAIYFLPLIFLWLVPTLRKRFKLSRIGYLVAEYDRLFGTVALRGLPAKPNLNMLATSMASGELCQFSRRGFTYGAEPFAGEEITVSFAVASSSAFPPLFPPAKLHRDEFGGAGKFGPKYAYLTDGGVFDNLGYQVIDGYREPAILSDAGAAFNSSETPRVRTIVGRTWRSTELLMKRVSDETLRNATAHSNLIQFRIGSTYGRSDSTGYADEEAKFISDTAQRNAARIRTDLDRFTEEEVATLVLHGFFTAARGLSLDIRTARKLELFPQKLLEYKHIQNSHRRKFLRFDWGDPMSLILGVTVAFLLGVISVIPKYVYSLNSSEVTAMGAGDQLDALNQQYVDQLNDLQQKLAKFERGSASPCDGTKVVGSFPLADTATLDGTGNHVGKIQNAKVTVIDTCTPPNSHASRWTLTYEYYNGQGTQHGDQKGILQFLANDGATLATQTFSIDRSHCVYGRFETRSAEGSLKDVGPLVEGARMTIGPVTGRQGGC